MENDKQVRLLHEFDKLIIQRIKPLRYRQTEH